MFNHDLLVVVGQLIDDVFDRLAELELVEFGDALGRDCDTGRDTGVSRWCQDGHLDLHGLQWSLILWKWAVIQRTLICSGSRESARACLKPARRERIIATIIASGLEGEESKREDNN